MTPTIDAAVAQAKVHDLPTPDPDSPAVRRRKTPKFSTLVATVENPGQKDQYGSSSVPIYQTATFKGVGGEYDYSRSGNPTRSHLEHHIAKISSAGYGFAVSSGMACLDTILRILKPGDEIITGDDLYGGTNRLLTYIRVHVGVTVHHVDTTDPSAILPFLHPTKTAMVLLESPTNPLLKIADISAICADVKLHAPEAVVVVDNTMMSPYLQRPLEHGADIVYDSATKYLSGHHDLMAGVITCNRDDLAKKLGFTINSVGNALTPNDCFLLLRGIKTLAVRMDRQQTNAAVVANYLNDLGFNVHYPGLPNHPGADIHHRLADGDGAVLSFETGDKELSERIVGATRLWGISVSFGCVNSLISMPCVMSHASIDPAVRAARGLPEDLIRLCVGIEDSSDLLDDLEHALLDAGAIRWSTQQNCVVKVDSADPLGEAVAKLALEQELLEEKEEWLVSAPGKIILFGEHAVVHGVTAIAASVDLRCYGLTTPRNDGKLSVHFHDIQNFYYEWDIAALPWDVVSPVKMGEMHPEVLDQNLVDALANGPTSGFGAELKHARTASLAFLYMYMIMSHQHRPSINFTARATLPVGAGLGSSASFSTCAAAALLLVHRRIDVPAPPAPATSGHIHISHQGRRALPASIAEEANRWAFTSEKILQGNPSGVDNSVSVYGGALAYTRAGFARKPGMEGIQGFKSLRFLLTNSNVAERDGKKMIANVGQLKVDKPALFASLIDAVQNISDEARRALADPEMSRELLLDAIAALMRENHEHLVNFGVSHPRLELIKDKTAATPYGLTTKLTGAGGGGCALSLIPDDFQETALQELMKDLLADKLDPYLTTVGGSGLGILSPHAHHRVPVSAVAVDGQPSGQVTPPVDPAVPHTVEGMRALMERTAVDGLSEWASGLGRWLYV